MIILHANIMSETSFWK